MIGTLGSKGQLSGHWPGLNETFYIWQKAYEVHCSYCVKTSFHLCLFYVCEGFLKCNLKSKNVFWGTFHPELRSIDLNQSGTFKIGIKIDVPLPKQMITNVHKALESSLSASIFSNLLPYMFVIRAYVYI